MLFEGESCLLLVTVSPANSRVPLSLSFVVGQMEGGIMTGPGLVAF